MADETLLDAIIKINVDGENVDAELENILGRVRTGLAGLGNIPKASLEPINLASLGKALEQLRQIRAQMERTGGSGGQYTSMTRALDELLSKEKALLAAQQRRLAAARSQAAAPIAPDPGPTAAAENKADARERERLARRARMVAEATAHQERLANSADPNRDRKLETLGRHLGAQEDPRTTDRLRAFNRRETALMAERDAALKNAMSNLGPAPERAGGASLDSRLGYLTQQRAAYEQHAPYTSDNKGRLEAINAEIEKLGQARIVAERRHLAALQRGADLAERATAKRQQELAKTAEVRAIASEGREFADVARAQGSTPEERDAILRKLNAAERLRKLQDRRQAILEKEDVEPAERDERAGEMRREFGTAERDLANSTRNLDKVRKAQVAAAEAKPGGGGLGAYDPEFAAKQEGHEEARRAQEGRWAAQRQEELRRTADARAAKGRDLREVARGEGGPEPVIAGREAQLIAQRALAERQDRRWAARTAEAPYAERLKASEGMALGVDKASATLDAATERLAKVRERLAAQGERAAATQAATLPAADRDRANEVLSGGIGAPGKDEARLAQLQREALEHNSRQAGASAVRAEKNLDTEGNWKGIEAESSSLRMRSLAMDSQRLRAKEADLGQQIRQVRVNDSIADAEQRLLTLTDQLVNTRSARLRNEATVRRTQWTETGRGGFMGGLTSGPFGSEGSEPGKFSGRDMAYQAGQATKYYALYSALNMVQMALADGVRMAGQYSRSIVDISTAYATNKESATEYANRFAESGAKLGLDLSSSIDAAIRFSTTFRNPDGTPDAAAGEQGAKLAGYFRVFSGDTDGKLDTSKQLADVAAILQAYNKPAAASDQLMDRALYIANQFGQRDPASMLSGSAMMGDLGRQSGFSSTEMQATVAGLMRNLGISGDVAGGDFKRFLGSQNSKEVTEVMDRYGIDVYQNFKEQLAELRPLLESMKPDERTRVLTSLGDDRTGSIVNALFKTADEASKVAGESETKSAGMAAKRAAEIMASFGEALNRFTAQATLAFVKLADAGLIEVLNSAANVLSIVVGGVGLLADALRILPGPIKSAVANLIALTAAARVARVVQTAAAGTQFATRAGEAWAAGRLFSADSVRGATQSRFGVANAAADGVTYTRSSVWQGLTRNMRDSSTAAMTFSSAAGGMARGIGSVAAGFMATAGPLLVVTAALGALQLVLSSIESAEKQKEAREGFDKSQKKINEENLGVADLEKEIENSKAEQAKMAEQAQGWGGFMSRLAKYSAKSKGFLAATDAGDQADAMAQKIARDEARLRQLQGEENAITEAQARENLGRPKSIWGPQFTPGSINRGVDLMKVRRFGAETSSAVMGDMLSRAPVEAIDGAPDAVAKGIEYMQKQVNAITDPIKRMEAQRANVEMLRAASDRLSAAGIRAGAVVELLQGSSEAANAAALQTIMFVTQRRIAHIKNISKDSPQARAQISELLSAAMDAALDTDSTEGFEAMLSLMDMADKAFLDKYERGLAAQRSVLEGQAAALAAASGMADAAAAKGGGDWDVGSLQSQYSKKGDEAAEGKADKATKKQGLFKRARELSAPEGSAYKWPTPAAAGPTADEIELARLGTLARPGDAISGARNAVRMARYRMAHHKNQVEYWNAVKELQESQFQLAQAISARAREALSATAVPGDSFSEAVVSLKVAKNALANSTSDNYWSAVKGLKEAQYRYSQEQLSAATSREMLAIDTTNPVARARAELNSAQRRRNYDKARGVSKETLAGDDVEIKDRRQALARTAWEQQFGDMATNHDLNRISLSAYMSYLNSQKAYLSAVKNKTRDQVDQLNQVDRALKSITEGMSSQWNLGDIKVPTPYEMRRALGVDGGYGGGANTVNNVSISISGADLNAVKGVLGDYLGQTRIQSAPAVGQRI